MNGGFNPTDLKALAGELTPPGIRCLARSKSFDDFDVFIFSMIKWWVVSLW